MDMPKYAMIEAERRFIVDKLPHDLLAGAPVTIIEDCYLDGGRLRLRRTVDPQTGAASHKLGKKYPSADAAIRPVVSVYLDEAEFQALASLPGNVLRKRRYRIATKGLWVAVDLFEGTLEGLALGEIETETAERLRDLEPPAWFCHEVTADPFFDGGNLAGLRAGELADRLQGRHVVPDKRADCQPRL